MYRDRKNLEDSGNHRGRWSHHTQFQLSPWRGKVCIPLGCMDPCGKFNWECSYFSSRELSPGGPNLPPFCSTSSHLSQRQPPTLILLKHLQVHTALQLAANQLHHTTELLDLTAVEEEVRPRERTTGNALHQEAVCAGVTLVGRSVNASGLVF